MKPKKCKVIFAIVLFFDMIFSVLGVKNKVVESEELSNFLNINEKAGKDEKKLVVEVEPADYENDFINNLRDQEDADRRFGMDDLGMIIEKITKNRYYPYPPSQPILASQFSLPNLMGSPYIGPYTHTYQQSQEGAPKFKEKNNNEEEFKQDNITNYNESTINKEEEKKDEFQFKEQQTNETNDNIKNAIKNQTINSDTTNQNANSDNKINEIEKIEENFLKEKLKIAMKTLNQLNENAKNLLKRNQTKNIEKVKENKEKNLLKNETISLF